MWKNVVFIACALIAALPQAAQAQAQPIVKVYDAELAKSLGANDNGMRSYVLVILKTGPRKMPQGPERSAMFKGHFANIERLAGEKKLALAGPLDGVDGLQGIFVFATPDIDVARTYVETDPVIINGEMVAEYHKFFSSAALMMISDVHNKIQKK